MKTLLATVMLLLSLSVTYAQEKRIAVPLEDSPTYGPANAPVTMIEFIDYQ